MAASDLALRTRDIVRSRLSVALAPCKVLEMTVSVATLGFPRIGLRRELKVALESYWSDKSTLADLHAAAAGLRVAHWARQKALGADILPSNDFRSTTMCSTPRR